MTPQQAAQAAAWGNFLSPHHANVAVTLCYNPLRPGTTKSPAYQINHYDQYLVLSTSGLSSVPITDRLPSLRHVPVDQVRKDTDWLHRKVDRKLFGTRFNKLPCEQRTRFIGWIEKPNHNIHAHLAWTVPDKHVDEFTEIVVEAWTDKHKLNSIRVKLIHDRGWGNYIAKDHWGAALSVDADLFVASRPARS